MQANSTILALDVGARRIGVARAHTDIRMAQPLTTLNHTADIMHTIVKLAQDEQAILVVVGLPRGLSGQDTKQTISVRQFVEMLETALPVPVVMQDEALTSQKAEAELTARGKAYTKEAVDALAATYILEDYFADHPKERSAHA